MIATRSAGFVGLVALVSLLPQVVAEESGDRVLAFSDGGWELDGEETAIETVGEREVLRLETGRAFRRDVRLQDGTIDFEVQVTDRRSFVYLLFRMTSDRDYEEIYLRPHKSTLPDALQYAPVWQGQSSWQLYHGPGGTAAADLEAGTWIPVRVVLQGRRAAVFVGDLETPALVVPRLAREPRAGYLALRGFLPRGVSSGPVARYSNVRIRPGHVPAAAASALAAAEGAPPDPPGTVHAWSVSSSFARPEEPALQLPDAATLGTMQRVEADPGGLVPLHRHVRLPEGSRQAAAVARVTVTAERAGLRRLDLGFSDEITVFLNGRPLVYEDDSYSFDAPRRQGVVYLGQATVFLPLEAGDNELAVVVGDRFGGWALMARFADPEGLRITAR